MPCRDGFEKLTTQVPPYLVHNHVSVVPPCFVSERTKRLVRASVDSYSCVLCSVSKVDGFHVSVRLSAHLLYAFHADPSFGSFPREFSQSDPHYERAGFDDLFCVGCDTHAPSICLEVLHVFCFASHPSELSSPPPLTDVMVPFASRFPAFAADQIPPTGLKNKRVLDKQRRCRSSVSALIGKWLCSCRIFCLCRHVSRKREWRAPYCFR